MRSSTRPRAFRKRALTGVLLLAVALGLLGTVPPLAAEAATCPCTVFAATQAPTNPSENDPDAVELGMKFRADQAGFVTGVRFYKGTGNTGSHTGSLWDSAGARLATVTFSGESASGWQEATFASPVAVSANTTYVVSYYAPSGHYAADNGYFSGAAVVSSPLTALQNGTDGGNGVYRYGTGGGFPASTYQSANYWVDVVFSTSGTDTTKPTVLDKQPAAGSTGVPVTSGASATFSEAVQPTTITMTLTGSGAVAATTSYDAASRTITLSPSSALATSTTYTVNLSGAKDTAGNTMDPLTWTFTTAATATGCPCTIWPSTTTPATAAANDSSAVELGVKFRANQAGYITGIRFYKGTGNTGTHVGSLWTRTGTKLASATFSQESATGWQAATFGAPVSIAAGHHLRRLVLRARRALRRQQRLLHERRDQPRPPDRARDRHRRGQRGLPLRRRRLPDQQLPGQQLLGRRRVRHHGQRHRGPHARLPCPGSGFERRLDDGPDQCRLLRAGGVRLGEHGPEGRGREHGARRAGLRRRQPDRDVHPERGARRLQPVQHDRERSQGRVEQRDGPGHVVLQHGGTTSAAPGPGAGRAHRRRHLQCQPLLEVPGRGLADRGAQRVRDHRRREPVAEHAGRLRRRRPRERERQRDPGRRPDDLGERRAATSSR